MSELPTGPVDPPPDGEPITSEALLRVLLRINRALHDRFQQFHATHHLSMPQYMLLRSLQVERQALSIHRIAAHARMTGSTVSGLLVQLERDGLVARQRDVGDRRVVLVRLTPAGDALLKTVPHFTDVFRDAGADAPPEEMSALYRMMVHVCEHIEQAYPRESVVSSQ